MDGITFESTIKRQLSSSPDHDVSSHAKKKISFGLSSTSTIKQIDQAIQTKVKKFHEKSAVNILGDFALNMQLDISPQSSRLENISLFMQRLGWYFPNAKTFMDSLDKGLKDEEKIKKMAEWLKENKFQFSEVSFLDLSGLGLTQLIDEITFFTNITEIDLDNNDLKDIPVQLKQLKKLETINLRNNPLGCLPKSQLNIIY